MRLGLVENRVWCSLYVIVPSISHFGPRFFGDCWLFREIRSVVLSQTPFTMKNAAMMLLLFVSVPLTLAEDAALPDALKSAEDKEESNNTASYVDEDEVVAEEGGEDSVQLAEVDESEFSVEAEVLSAGNSGLLNSEQGISADMLSGGSTTGSPNSTCHTATSGTCSWTGCAKSRGPTRCVKGKCVCKAGSCSDGKMCKKSLCNTATSGTCSWTGCAKSRGPTRCVKGKCLCKRGSCSDGKMCKAAVP
ncbi:unnamed protein product [Polarella glacialis]|uniref:Uncharacterized protein n=1 Tax=Polarella glacialis TaxID=89957 RepID=A0A813LJI7_POLGL|nr:unnamed protein product [Polarella glacialis]